MKSYIITRPHFSFDPQYNGESYLCESNDDRENLQWRSYFALFGWNPITRPTINACLDVIAQEIGVNASTHLFVMTGQDGFEVYTFDQHHTTLDGSEHYNNGLQFVALIQED
jgi:hypothetical protein